MGLYDNTRVKIWMYHVASVILITADGEHVEIPSIRLKEMQIIEDYEHYVLPVFRVTFILEPNIYYKILQNKDTGKIYLRINKYFKSPNSNNMSMYREFIDDMFDLILDDSTEDLLYSQKRQISEDNYLYVTKNDRNALKEVANTITFFLFRSKSIEGIKSSNANVILKNATIADAIGYLVTKSKIDNVLFAQPDNTEINDILLIPPLSVLKSFQHLDLYYGIYKTGSMLYFGIKYVYIIPYNGNCVAYASGEKKKTVVLIPKTSDIYHTTTLGELYKEDESSTYIVGDYKTLSARNESISNNYIMGNDADMMDAYTGESIVNLSNATTKTKNFLRLLENKTENKYLAQMYTAQTRSGSSVISVSCQDIDIDCISPNKEYQILFEDTIYSTKYKGKYMISSAIHTFMNTGADMSVNCTCIFRRE